MYFLRNCGVWALHSATVTRISMTNEVSVSRWMACRCIRLYHGCRIHRADVQQQTAGRRLSSSNRNISLGKPFCIVMNKDSQHATLADVLDVHVRLEQLSQESLRHAVPETQCSSLVKSDTTTKQKTEMPRTKHLKKSNVSDTISKNTSQDSKCKSTTVQSTIKQKDNTGSHTGVFTKATAKGIGNLGQKLSTVKIMATHTPPELKGKDKVVNITELKTRNTSELLRVSRHGVTRKFVQEVPTTSQTVPERDVDQIIMQKQVNNQRTISGNVIDRPSQEERTIHTELKIDEKLKKHPSRKENIEKHSSKPNARLLGDQRLVFNQSADERTRLKTNKKKSVKQTDDVGSILKNKLPSITPASKGSVTHRFHIFKDKSSYLEPLIEVCNHKNMLNRALSEFENAKKSKMEMDVDLYNMLLKGLSEKGDLNRVRSLFAEMMSAGIQPNVHSYASLLQCIGRMKVRHLETASKCFSDMTMDNISIDDLFLKTFFANDDRAVMLKVIRSVKPGYTPPRPPSRPSITNALVQDLYTEGNGSEKQTYEDSSGRTLSCSGVLTKELLMKNFKEQLDMEIQEAVIIPSIEDDGNPDSQTVYKIRSSINIPWTAANMSAFSKTGITSLRNDQFVSFFFSNKQRRVLNEHKKLWKMNLMQAIKEETEGVKKKSARPGGSHMKSYAGLLYPCLQILTPEEYADLILQKVFDTLACSSEGMSMINLSVTLVNMVYRKLVIRSKVKRGIKEKLKRMYSAFSDYNLNESAMQQYKSREYWQKLEDTMLEGPSLNYEMKPWKGVISSLVECVTGNNNVLVEAKQLADCTKNMLMEAAHKQAPPAKKPALGFVLADILIREIRIDTAIANPNRQRKLIPAFYNMYTFKTFKSTSYVKPHPLLVDLIESAKEPNIIFDSTVLPMLVPPVPWNSVKYGGYVLTETRIARCPEDSLQDQQLKDPSRLPEWYSVMDSLNQLASVPWKVNKPILDLIISVFKNNGSKELNIPQPASACPPPPAITRETSEADIAQAYRERGAYHKLKGEMHALRMNDMYKLSIANKYRDKIFWFPHNLDFRGRVYPCPPHFNHIGNDVTRCILVFARGRPLGEKGLDWLKIHLVNLTGFLKRASQQDRLQYADEMMPLILDSADNPMEGKKWWQGADKQWQTLACCMEIANAVRSNNPAEFISHFPVHQDGSCNGLQHYAALGRDTHGAHQVNLHPFDTPQDVYSGVAEMVEQQRAQDALHGNEIACCLEGLVERKVVKQTVMTIVYGVTAYGANLQILKQLKEKEGLTDAQKRAASKYLAGAVFNSLEKMFTKTREIQNWLTETARHISKAGHCVDWQTPLGLPVVQPYLNTRQLVKHKIKGRSFQGVEFENNAKSRIDTLKQRNGFPPNFIHSLDSTHMMLTSLYCQQAGITFVSVHDCYWTHASTVEDMNRICREQFVKLHEQPILQDLSTFLITKYGDIKISKDMKKMNTKLTTINDVIEKVPGAGDFDLKNVLKSTYFFS